mgnify:CR=1 FL=1
MKDGIHPNYREVCFQDLSNGFKFVTRSCAQTKETIKLDDGRELPLIKVETNVWFVSGDIHLGTLMRIEATGPRRKYFEICAGPAGNINPLAIVLEPGNEKNKPDFFPDSQFLYASGAFQATLFTFDPAANTVRVRFLDPKQGDAATCDQTVRFGQGA